LQLAHFHLTAKAAALLFKELVASIDADIIKTKLKTESSIARRVRNSVVFLSPINSKI
jgi:hypothetical protein